MKTSARKPIHFSYISADISGEKTISPTCLPLIVTGNAASISGMAIRSTNQCGTRPNGVRTSGWTWGTPVPAGLKRIASDVPSACTKASSVCSGIGRRRQGAVERPGHGSRRTLRRLALVHQLAGGEDLQRDAADQDGGNEHRAEREQQAHAKGKVFPHSGYSNSNAGFSRFNLSLKPVYSERDFDDAKFCQIDHARIDRRRPPGGPVGLPFAVRIRRFGEDRRGCGRQVRSQGLYCPQAGCHGDRYQAARRIRLRTDAANPQGRSGRQDHHVQHERRSGFRGSRRSRWARRATFPRATIPACW